MHESFRNHPCDLHDSSMPAVLTLNSTKTSESVYRPQPKKKVTVAGEAAAGAEEVPVESPRNREA